MSIEYRAELKSQYAQLTCHGNYGKKELLDLFDRAMEFAAENGLQAVLVDLSDIEGGPDITERFEVGAHFAEMQLSKETIVALAVIGKVFTDRDEAISWLEHTSG